ncbi:MAG: hypothetical protein NXI18_13485 [Alphaproteobacteria bacterium]|nr:hypothetical protein [Alphaproteobacteria bacterium]
MSAQHKRGGVVPLPFATPRQAALAVLTKFPDLRLKTAGFLGYVCVADQLTDKQHGWLVSILEKRGLPPLSDGWGD